MTLHSDGHTRRNTDFGSHHSALKNKTFKGAILDYEINILSVLLFPIINIVCMLQVRLGSSCLLTPGKGALRTETVARFSPTTRGRGGGWTARGILLLLLSTYLTSILRLYGYYLHFNVMLPVQWVNLVYSWEML